MIRVLALAHMVEVNRVSSKLLYDLCGQDKTYYDLLTAKYNVWLYFFGDKMKKKLLN